MASKSLSEGVDNRVDALIRGVDPDGTAAGRIAGRDSPWGYFSLRRRRQGPPPADGGSAGNLL